MTRMTLWNIARVCQGRFVIPDQTAGLSEKENPPVCPQNGMAQIRQAAARQAEGVVLDSRKVRPGYVFVATVGERVDGHLFIEEAFRRGAIGVVCEKEPSPLPGPCIIVKDSFQALSSMAEFYRTQRPVPLIGITGSVGKTSTKEFVASVLGQKYRTHRTEGNYNNEVGVPLTLLSMPEDAQAVVLEMGMNHFGEMHRLSRIAKPNICVITNIGQCHLENLGSRDGILKAKSEIFDFMDPEGKICLFGDDDKLETIRQVGTITPVRFGFDAQKNDIYATDVKSRGLLGSVATIHADSLSFPVQIPLPGIHMVQNALAATAVGLLMGLSVDQIREGIASVSAVQGRSRVLRAKDMVLIDDCYNANPVSMKAAVDLLGMAEGRKVAVLGDMFELGPEERALHAEVGRYAAQHGVDCLLCAGTLSKDMYEAAKTAGMKELFYYANRQALLADLPHRLRPGDSVLIKASHGMGFEAVVKALLEER